MLRSRLAAGLALAAVCGCGESSSSNGASSGGSSGASGAGTGGATGGSGGAPVIEWPNAESQATSDPWIAEHHDEIQVMRPRVLAINFVNARSMADMHGLLSQITAAIREATRPHGTSDANAKPFLEYELKFEADLRDDPPPSGWTYNNSTLYPRQQPVVGQWGFDYGKLFTEEYAARFGIEDPLAPGKMLTLCEASEKGLVHEVWIYADADVPDASAAEVLGIQPAYDASFKRISDALNHCAGNGCFDAEDVIPAACTRTLRIGFVNDTRGVGCYMESLSHGIETIGQSNDIPYFSQYFPEFGGFDLDQRFGLPFESWYACSDPDCLTYPTSSSVSWKAANQAGTIDPYVPVCGNAHLPPNARNQYDVVNDQPVASQCRAYRTQGGPDSDPSELTSHADWAQYEAIAGDCTGQWLVWWWQNFPGFQALAKDAQGKPMKNWWPFLFY